MRDLRIYRVTGETLPREVTPALKASSFSVLSCFMKYSAKMLRPPFRVHRKRIENFGAAI